jgi:hypothetical protein
VTEQQAIAMAQLTYRDAAEYCEGVAANAVASTMSGPEVCRLLAERFRKIADDLGQEA